ncbi:TetR/AcrR family transcriptional regulator [Acidovorax sp. 22279]|uniref:TetR/AcrR family transcriptional regulator n=1 Tax=Acidovorax sp. 22279 TaxID=3453900 RepID=UPI003F84FBE7
MKPLTIDSATLMGSHELATPQQRKRESRLQAILETAQLVFRRDGYAAFTLRHVAAEAGVQLGTLQHYFPSRELLLRTMIVQTIRSYNEDYDRIARSEAPVERRMQAIIEQVLREVQDESDRTFLLEMSALACHEHFAAEALVESHRQYLGMWGRLIGEMNPGLNADERRMRALLIAAQLEGLMPFLQVGTPGAVPDSKALAHAVRVVAISLSSA